MRFVGFILSLLSFSPAFAQLVEFPLASQKSETRSASTVTGRTQSTTLTLPFWDDFSYSDVQHYPDTSIWLYGNTVFLNNGIGINAPSKNVVTFDGLDSQGKPYNVNDILAKGFADTLISKPIRMSLVAPALRSTTYVSFFFQVKGLGETPDPGDNLILSFKNASLKWEAVYTIENSDAFRADKFYHVLIPIDDKFFHDKFQIKFQNFARLSGAYDTWNVDYIYINTNRNINDRYYPDRAVSSQLNSLFVDYYAMPLKHFLKNPAANLKVPSVMLHNLTDRQPQPITFNTSAKITTYHGTTASTTTLVLDVASSPNPPSIDTLAFLTVSLNNIPPVSAFDTTATAISAKLIYTLNSSDNIDPVDYKPQYIPIDFRRNDTTSMSYQLSSYYAYDDGGAEYAFKLSQAGAYAAFKYLFKSTKPDNLVGVNIYFPEFGDNTAQSIQLQVRSDLSDSPSSILYQKTVQVVRSARPSANENLNFTSYTFDPAIPITGDFYIGWKQLTNAVIPVGLDKNNNNANKMFYNTNGTWVQNTSVIGSPMVRPVFGNGVPPVITGVENLTHDPIYPNPTSKICFLPFGADQIRVMDITGRNLDIELQPMTDRTSLTFVSTATGLVIIRYVLNGRLITEKIMVLAE